MKSKFLKRMINAEIRENVLGCFCVSGRTHTRVGPKLLGAGDGHSALRGPQPQLALTSGNGNGTDESVPFVSNN